MNKLVIFIIGVSCGFALSRLSTDHPKMESVLKSTSESDDIKTFTSNAHENKMPVIHRSEAVVSASPSVILQSPTETVEAPSPPHPVNFVFNEETLETMEQNIVTLQKEVSVIKDRDGWILRFHSPDNLLSHIGLSDNDLIRFHQLDEMRLNPDTQDLALRMESVLANLER